MICVFIIDPTGTYLSCDLYYMRFLHTLVVLFTSFPYTRADVVNRDVGCAKCLITDVSGCGCQMIAISVWYACLQLNQNAMRCGVCGTVTVHVMPPS